MAVGFAGRPGVSPQDVASAYRAAGSGAAGSGAGPKPDAAGADGFGALLTRAMQGAVETGHAAEAKATAALTGQGSIAEVVQAVSRAELALQTTTAIRDRVVQAYQDIMRMPI